MWIMIIALHVDYDNCVTCVLCLVRYMCITRMCGGALHRHIWDVRERTIKQYLTLLTVLAQTIKQSLGCGSVSSSVRDCYIVVLGVLCVCVGWLPHPSVRDCFIVCARTVLCVCVGWLPHRSARDCFIVCARCVVGMCRMAATSQRKRLLYRLF
jgi:hypothetical protein